MSNLYDDAWLGTLTADSLKLYLATTNIDSVGGQKSLTPLAAASSRGHLDIILLLLDHHASPNAPSPYGRTPLFYATSKSPVKDRLAIVRALLDASAQIDACSANDDLYTPLMNAVTEIRDKKVVHELVHRGASLTQMNAQGQTAQELAKESGMERDLRPRAQRKSKGTQIIDPIITVVLTIIARIIR